MASQPTDGQRHRAQLAALYADQPRAHLIALRPAGDALMVTIGQPDGTAQLVRVVKLDQAELSVLPEQDRNRIRHALASLHLKRAEAFLSRPEPQRQADVIADSLRGLAVVLNHYDATLATNLNPRTLSFVARSMEKIESVIHDFRNVLNGMLPEGFEPPPEDLLPEGDDGSR